MRRRAFLGGLGVLGASAAVTLPAHAKEHGVYWQPKCFYCKFKPAPIFVDLTAPVGVPNQCPKCLCVYDTSELGEQIKEFNRATATVVRQDATPARKGGAPLREDKWKTTNR